MSVILCYLIKALGETHDQMITFQKPHFPAFFLKKLVSLTKFVGTVYPRIFNFSIAYL